MIVEAMSAVIAEYRELETRILAAIREEWDEVDSAVAAPQACHDQDKCSIRSSAIGCA